MAVNTYTKAGAKATTAAKLDKAVFELEVANHELLKQAYDAYLANGRANYAVVKTRGEVRGGGKKPWKQKGTGNARVGSRRNPVWRGGGIVFGPTGNENYTKNLNVKAKRLAVKQSLSIAASEGRISVIDDITSKEGKTAELAGLLNKIGANRRVLIVVNQVSEELNRAAQNLQNVALTQATYLNVFDTVNADTILFTADALAATTAWLSVSAREAK